MSEDLGALVAKLQADVSHLKKGLRESRDELRSFKDLAVSAGAKVKQALTFVGVAAGIYEIAGALKSFIQNAAMTGARTETLQIAMEQVGKTYGVSAQSLQFYVEKLKAAGITTQESMTAVTKAMTTGIPLNQLEALATRARDIAVVAGVNTSEALNRIMQGILTGEQETLRRMMVPVGSWEDIYKQFAAGLGKTEKELNAVEKAQARLNEVMRVTAGYAGVAAAADASVGKQLQSMARFAEEAKNALWALFGPVMSAGVQEMTQGWKNLEAWAKANKDRLMEWGKTGAEWLKWLAAGIRDIGSFISENKKLIGTFLELYVATKAAGWIAGMGTSIKTTAVEVGILAALLGKLKLLMGGVWKIVITVALIGFYEAWNKIQQLRAQAGFTPQAGAVSRTIQEGRARDKAKENQELDIAGAEAAREAQRRGISTEQYLALAKEDQKRAIEGRYKKYTAPSVLPPVLPEHETPQERADREAKAVLEKAKADAPKPAAAGGKGGGGGKGAAETVENFLAPLLALYKAKRAAELEDAQNSLDLLKTTNDKKRAELEKDLAAGLIDGQTYYTRLMDLQKQETAAALAMIAQKRQAQQKAHQESLSEIEADGRLSDAAKNLRRQKLEAENRQALAKLDTEAKQTALELEVKTTNELKRQLESRKEIAEILASGQEAAALGAVAEKEAEINRLLRERAQQRLDLAGKAGVTPDALAQFDSSTTQQLFNKKFGDQIKNYASTITDFFTDITDKFMEGETHFRDTFKSFFKNIFNQSIKPAINQLQQWLTDAFKSMFGSLGGGIASSLMGIIGLVGMFLSSDNESEFTSSGVTSNVTGSESVRGIIAGDTSIPIAEISTSLSEATAPHLSVLRQIEANTRKSGAGGAGGGTLNINIQGMQESIREAIETYFREYLLTGAGG